MRNERFSQDLFLPLPPRPLLALGICTEKGYQALNGRKVQVRTMEKTEPLLSETTGFLFEYQGVCRLCCDETRERRRAVTFGFEASKH